MTEDGERCSKAMGCDGVRCIWDAGKQGCMKWCRAHAQKWVPSLMAALDGATTPIYPALFTVDKLIFENKKGAFVRGRREDIPSLIRDSQSSAAASPSAQDEGAMRDEIATTNSLLSDGKLHIVSAKFTICGLEGGPGEDVIADWESTISRVDLLDFAKFRGFSKRTLTVERSRDPLWSGEEYESDKNHVVRRADGTVQHVTRNEAAAIAVAALSDPSTSGTRVFYEFKLIIDHMSPQDTADICEAFDTQDPTGVELYKSVSGNGGRSYVVEQKMSGGGASLSLDCGSFVVHWHSLAFLLLSLPSVRGGRAYVDLVMNW